MMHHSVVRWLSQGLVLQRFFYLKKEICFIMEKKRKIIPELYNSEWIADFEFLTDLITELNVVNTCLQAKNKFPCQLYSDVKAFEMKLIFL